MAAMVSRSRMGVASVALVVGGGGGLRAGGPGLPAPDGLHDVGGGEGEGGEGQGDAGQGGGLNGGAGVAAVGEEGVHVSVLRSAECGLDLLQDGAGGGSEPVAVVAVQMVVRGGHAGQAAEGGDEDVEA